jgi:hypothetical protein
MDHTTAVSEHSAERYLLGEMPAVEAEAFERHYFECPECALAVEAGQVFVANGRAVLDDSEAEADRKSAREAPRQSLWDALFAWRHNPAFAFSMAAALVFGGLSLYQGTVQIPRLRHTLDEARVLPAFQLAPVSRGDASRVTVPLGTRWFSVAGDLPPDAHFPGYVCDLSAGGKVRLSLPAPAPALGQPITILLSANDVPAGTYDLAIYGVDADGKRRDRVSAFSFTLEFH